MMHSGASGSSGWLVLAGILALGVLAAVGAVLATRGRNGTSGWLAVVVGAVVGLTGLALAAQAYATPGMPMARHADFPTAGSAGSCTSSPPSAGQTVEVVVKDMSRMPMWQVHRMTLSARCGPGQGGGIRSGQLGWVTRTLSPGRYELVCNVPGHYASGMWTQLVVR